MDNFLSTVQKRFIIGDGPMGTMLFSRLGNSYETVEEFNLYKPKEVVRLHKDYIEAGAMLLGASTFSANRIRLSRSGVLNKLEDMNRLGVELAKEAAGDRAWVMGKMGPTGKILQPLGDLSIDEAREAYLEQAAILADAGADLLGVETMGDLTEAQVAIEAMRSVSDLPTVVSFTFDANLRTLMGISPERAAAAALEWGADIVGSNCGIGPDEVENSIIKMREVVPKALFLTEPNAGLPQLIDGQAVYGLGPGRFADYAENSVRMGVKVISACCGSTPDHIRAMVDRVEKYL
ncbi:Bifunctional homocysteine S-methyltransferase/5,10-methylenetetrahydrofolate reductase [subsurface metagenome]